MTAQIPTTRETLNNGVLMQLADILKLVGFGDFLAALIQKCLGGARIQSGRFTATGASQVLTFAGLGMVPPLSTAYNVIASCETTNCRLDESTKTLTGFTLLNTTNTEPINVIVIEDDGPGVNSLTVASNAAALPAQPLAILDVVATAGTTLGRKVLKIGGSDITPLTGEVVWDGGTSLRFAAVDAVTAVRVSNLPKASPLVTSALNRILGQAQ